MSMYFAEDGNYGGAANLLIIEDDEWEAWTPEMQEAVEVCPDSVRLGVVQHFSEGVHFRIEDDDRECYECGLVFEDIHPIRAITR